MVEVGGRTPCKLPVLNNMESSHTQSRPAHVSINDLSHFFLLGTFKLEPCSSLAMLGSSLELNNHRYIYTSY